MTADTNMPDASFLDGSKTYIGSDNVAISVFESYPSDNASAKPLDRGASVAIRAVGFNQGASGSNPEGSKSIVYLAEAVQSERDHEVDPGASRIVRKSRSPYSGMTGLATSPKDIELSQWQAAYEVSLEVKIERGYGKAILENSDIGQIKSNPDGTVPLCIEVTRVLERVVTDEQSGEQYMQDITVLSRVRLDSPEGQKLYKEVYEPLVKEMEAAVAQNKRLNEGKDGNKDRGELDKAAKALKAHGVKDPRDIFDDSPSPNLPVFRLLEEALARRD